MTRPTRLAIGSTLCLALACASLQKAAERVPPDDRVNAAWLVTREACFACGDKCSAETLARCEVFMPQPDDAPHSGDSGPAISQGSASGDGSGVRSIGGSGAVP